MVKAGFVASRALSLVMVERPSLQGHCGAFARRNHGFRLYFLLGDPNNKDNPDTPAVCFRAAETHNQMAGA